MELIPDDEYRRHVEAEIEHYAGLFEAQKHDPCATLFQPVPPAWIEVEKRAAALISATTGADLNGHVVARLRARSGVGLTSLGSGPAGIELAFARQAPESAITCYDLNPQLLELARARVAAEALNLTCVEADLNHICLPPQSADIVFCHAALHHLIELEHVASEIRRALRAGGELIVVDVITDNGYRMWPETREAVRSIWRTLPARYRINHTAYPSPRLDFEPWESDTSESGMECIRSRDILPVLDGMFTRVAYVPYFALVRRFLDTMYGPNYDLSEPADLALLDWLWQLDLHHLGSGGLRPETFFAIYRAR